MRRLDRRHVEAHKDHVRCPPGLAVESPIGFRPGGKPAVDLEGFRPLGAGDDPPPGGFLSGQGIEIQIRPVGIPDHARVTVGDDPPFRVGNDQVVHAGLLGRLDEQFLQLKAPPGHPFAGPRARLEGTDEGFPLFQKEPCAHFHVAVHIFPREKCEKRDQHRHGPQDDPGGNKQPKFFLA